MPDLVLVMTLAAGIAGHTIPVPPFHMLDLAARATVQVEQAPAAGVVVSGDPRLVRCVTADVRDGRLVLGWAGRSPDHGRATTADGDIIVTARAGCPRQGDPQRLAVRVTTPTLDGVTLSDQGAIHVAPLRTPILTASIVERGAITIDGLRANATRLSIGGVGRISVSGEVGKLAASVAGAGAIDTRAARATGIDVKLGGRGTIAATVNGTASGRLAGGGTIMIGGHPVCAITNPGRGRIMCPAMPS